MLHLQKLKWIRHERTKTDMRGETSQRLTKGGWFFCAASIEREKNAERNQAGKQDGTKACADPF